jgi:hypothetical protein
MIWYVFAAICFVIVGACCVVAADPNTTESDRTGCVVAGLMVSAVGIYFAVSQFNSVKVENEASADTANFASSVSSFADCLSGISKIATEFGATPINVVETSSMRVVRFSVTDGSVLVTCLRTAPFMSLAKSDRRCGYSVSC